MSGRRNMVRNRSQNRNSHEVHKRPSQDSRLSTSYDRLQNKVHHISPVDSKSHLRHSRDKDSQRHFSSSDRDKDLIHNRARAFAATCQSDQIKESMKYQDSIHDRTRVFSSSSQSDDINSASYRQERLNSGEDLEEVEKAHHLDNRGHHGRSRNSGRHQDRDEDQHIRADADRKPSLGPRKDNDRVPYPIRDSEQQVTDDSCRDLRHKQREDDRAQNRHAGDDLSTNRHLGIKNDGEIALRPQSGENLDREQLQQHRHEQDQSQHLDSVQDCDTSQHRNSFAAQIMADEGRGRSRRYLEERERALHSNRREGRDRLQRQSRSPDGRRFREDENKSLMEVRDRAEGFSSGQVTDRERYTKSGYSTPSQSFIDFYRMQDSHLNILNLLNSAKISSHQSSQVPVEQMSQEAVSLAIFSALGATGQAHDNRFANASMTSTVSNPRNTGITNHTTINHATSVITQVPATCPLVSCRATVPFLREHILMSHLPSCFANTSDTSVVTMRQRSIVLHAFAQEFTDSGGLPGLLNMIQSSGLISGAAELELDLLPALQAFSEFLGEPVPEHYTLNPPNACSVLTHWRILLQLLCVGGKDVQERFSSQSEAHKLMQSISQFGAVSSLGPAAGRSVVSSHGTGALMPPQSVSFQDLGSGSASVAGGPLKTLRRVPPSSDHGSHFTMSCVKSQSRRNNRIPSTSEVLFIRQHDTDRSSTQERQDSGGSGGGKEVYKRKCSPSAGDIPMISKRYSVEQIQRRLDNCTGDSHHRDLLPDNHEPQDRYGSKYGDRHMSPPSSLQTLPFDRYTSSSSNHPILPERPHEGRHLSPNNQILPAPHQDYSSSRGDRDKHCHMVNYGDIQIKDREPAQQDALIRMAQCATDDNPEQPDVTVTALSKKPRRRRARKQIEHKWEQMIKAQQKQMDNAWRDNAGLQAADTVHSDAFGSDGQTGADKWLYTSRDPGLQQAAYAIFRERSLGHAIDTGIPAAVDCHFYLDVVAISLFTKQGLMRRSVGLDSLQENCLKPNANLIQLVGAIGVFSNPDHYGLLMGEKGNTRWYTQDGRLGLSVGFNPKFTKSLTDSLLEHIRQLARLPSMKAYGDVGLSYSTGDEEAWALQRANLRQLLRIAPSSLPVKLSCRQQKRETTANAGPRDAYQDLLDIAREELAPVQPIYLASFNGNDNTVRSWLSLFPNCYFGISPNCIKSAFDARHAIGLIPEDRLLLESSSPSFRLPGYTKNSPLFLGVLAKYVGKFRKLEDAGHILAVTTANARRLFSLA